MWEKIKNWFNKPVNKSKPQEELSEVKRLALEDNPWKVPLLDIGAVTQTLLSTSSDKQCAINAMSFLQDDGTSFIGVKPIVSHIVEANLQFPIDQRLADGVLFTPREMEHKWAIFYHSKQIICVRSWLRKVYLVADIEEFSGYIKVTKISGVFTNEDEPPSLTIHLFDYLLRSHVLNLVYPVALPSELETDLQACAMWCFSLFGNLALLATAYEFNYEPPKELLRTNSLLHIAVAKADINLITFLLEKGMPIELIAQDGLALLHWSLALDNNEITDFLLKKGLPIDVRSIEGATPLMNAVQKGKTDKVAFLLERGADPNAIDNRGFTALHRAAELGHIEVVKLLIQRGANPNPNAQGHTPLSLAETRGHLDIIEVLNHLQ